MSTSNQGQQTTQNQQEFFKVTRIITLQASDGPRFEVTEPIAMQMGTVRSLLEEDDSSASAFGSSITVPLLNVPSTCLVKVIEYCKKHGQFRAKSTPEDQVKAFDSGLVKDLSNDMIIELLLCSNYLDAKELLEMVEKAIAKRIEDKSPEFVRKFFGIECDFSPEEEARVRHENKFAFDDIDDD
ncbi:hypothetical protein ACOSQ3_028233 [Xanthoceras sorbifolium]